MQQLLRHTTIRKQTYLNYSTFAKILNVTNLANGETNVNFFDCFDSLCFSKQKYIRDVQKQFGVYVNMAYTTTLDLLNWIYK